MFTGQPLVNLARHGGAHTRIILFGDPSCPSSLVSDSQLDQVSKLLVCLVACPWPVPYRIRCKGSVLLACHRLCRPPLGIQLSARIPSLFFIHDFQSVDSVWACDDLGSELISCHSSSADVARMCVFILRF